MSRSYLPLSPVEEEDEKDLLQPQSGITRTPEVSQRSRAIRLLLLSCVLNVLVVGWAAYLWADRRTTVTWRGAKPLYSECLH